MAKWTKKGFLKCTAWIALTEGNVLRALMKNYSLIQLCEKWEKYEKQLEGNDIKRGSKVEVLLNELWNE